MDEMKFFDDIHSFIHRFGNWYTIYREEMNFESYLRQEEPKRHWRLWRIYLLLEEMYKDER